MGAPPSEVANGPDERPAWQESRLNEERGGRADVRRDR